MFKFEFAFYGAIAMLGGLVKYANHVMSGRREFNPKLLKCWFALFVELMTSFFVGMLIFYFATAYNLNPSLSYGLAGVAGHLGGTALDIARKVIESKLGVKSDD